MPQRVASFQAIDGQDLLAAGGNFRRLACTALRPSCVTDRAAEIFDVDDPALGDDAEPFPDKPPQRIMKSTSRAELSGG